jgi:cell division protein FtsZ
MPRREDLPAIARTAMDGEDTDEIPPKNARALFRRLASNVGLQRKDEDLPGERIEPAAGDDAAARSAVEAAPPKRAAAGEQTGGAAGKLDRQGRPNTAAPTEHKDHIEIPSFLRRHG